jgi:asparagine synthase (glutamine-hydrolysing)
LRTPYLDNEIVALACQIPESIRTSPVPALRFVKNNDPVLSSIPTDMGGVGENRGAAAALRHVFSKVTFKLDYLNNEGLPHWLSPFDPLLRRFNSRTGILGLHKHLHYRSWFQRELAGYVKDVLTDGHTQRSPFWNSDFLESMATEHTRGRKNYVLEINAVLTLEAVERLFFRELPSGVSSLTNSSGGARQRESLLTT